MSKQNQTLNKINRLGLTYLPIPVVEISATNSNTSSMLFLSNWLVSKCEGLILIVRVT